MQPKNADRGGHGVGDYVRVRITGCTPRRFSEKKFQKDKIKIRKMRFDELELEDEILDGLYDMNFQEMTPVQEHTIPVILEGRDIIGCAQTGTGKTAAYTLPLLNRLLLEGNEDNVIKSVIIVPTRELAQQIRPAVSGLFLLPAHLDHGRLRRRRRQGLGRAEAGHADGVRTWSSPLPAA